METTYTETAAKTSKEEVKVTAEGKASKSALILFITGVTLVFSMAVYYCMNTGYPEVAGILGVAYVVVLFLGRSFYKSFK